MSRNRDTANVQYNGVSSVPPFVAGKNKIINGDFSIWQRGTTFNGVNNTYAADRWACGRRDGSGATVNVTQQTFTPGTAPVAGYEGSYYLRVQQTVAGSGGTYNVPLDQRIEDVRTLAGQTVTLSFWAKADTVRGLSVNLEQIFGTGGSGTVYGIGGTSFSIGTTWQRYSLTTTMPSVSGKTIGTGSYITIPFQPGSNITYTFDFWGIQLEAGSVATPFTNATGNYASELLACMRYFQLLRGGITTTGNFTTHAYGSFQFPPMRTTPSVALTGPLNITDPGTAGFSQSSAIVAIAAAQDNCGIFLDFANFSGLTAYRSYLFNATGGANYVTLSSEL